MVKKVNRFTEMRKLNDSMRHAIDILSNASEPRFDRQIEMLVRGFRDERRLMLKVMAAVKANDPLRAMAIHDELHLLMKAHDKSWSKAAVSPPLPVTMGLTSKQYRTREGEELFYADETFNKFYTDVKEKEDGK